MADASSGPLVRVEGVVKEYGEHARSRVLHGVDMTLERGEFAALMGPSGSGKSTLLNIVGLLDRPTSGRVLIEDTDTSFLDELGLTAFRGKKLGFIFQFHHLLPAFSAVENVMLPAWAAAGHPSRPMRERAEELLRGVGLADRLQYRPTELSGGQQQRVAIARALAHDPPLVLADEPTGNLDTKSSDEALALMRDFNRQQGTTFLLVTHDPRIAERCDRVLEIVDGRMVSVAPPPAVG